MPSYPTTAQWNHALQRYVVDSSGDARGVNSSHPVAQFFSLTILPLIPALALILWPIGLGSEEVGTIQPWSFMVFQGLYTLIGLPIMLQLYDFTLPGMPWSYTIGLVFGGQVCVQGFFIWYTDAHPLQGLGLVRAMGPVFYASLIVIFHTAFWGSALLKAPQLVERQATLRREEDEHGVQLEHNLSFRQNTSSSPGLIVVEEGQHDRPEFLSPWSSHLMTKAEVQGLLLSSPPLSESCERFRNPLQGKELYPVLARLGIHDPSLEHRELFLWSPACQLVVAFAVLGCLFSAFFFCQWISLTFFSSDDAASGDRTVIFLMFSLAMNVMKFVFKRIGRVADKMKTVGPSVEVAVECYMSAFYFTFYRILFVHITDWGTYAGIKCVHVATELMLHPFRMTDIYHSTTSHLQKYIIGVPVLSLVHDDATQAQFFLRLSFDFMIRRLMSQFAAVAFSVTVCFIRYGYNKSHYNFFVANVEDKQFAQMMYYLTIGVVIELAILFACWSYFHGRRRLPCFFCTFSRMLNEYPELIFFIVFTAAHILTDVFLARVVLGTTWGEETKRALA